LFVRIPMRGVIGSLNAAVAGSILLFEALGQRDPDARPGGATVGADGSPSAGPAAPAKPRRTTKRAPKGLSALPAEPDAEVGTEPAAESVADPAPTVEAEADAATSSDPELPLP
jgi:hypothetical protein